VRLRHTRDRVSRCPIRRSPSGRRSLGVSFRPTRDHPLTDVRRPLPCASHNPPGPAAAGHEKGRPQADPEGTGSTLPATEAAGTLIGVGSASPIPRACRRASRIPFCSHVSTQPTARRAVTGEPAASPHPVPKTLSEDRIQPPLLNRVSAGQERYPSTSIGRQSRGRSSRCTTTSESYRHCGPRPH
jgi:hypothetical protein